jgi:hypothetical protein
MTLAAIQTQIEQRTRDCKALQSFWRSLIPGSYPSAEQFALWLETADAESVVYGIRATAKRFHTLCGKMDAAYQVRYCSSVVLNHLKEEQVQR